METRSGRLAAESEHEEVRLVVEAAAALFLNGDALSRSTESEHADGRLVAEAAAAAAAHHPDTDMNATATDSEHAEGRLLAEAAEATATIDLDDDAEHKEGRLVNEAAEAAAATAKGKPKRRDAMSESQENKNEKISERDDEIRSLVEERRNIAKVEKHQMKELSKR